MARYRPKDSVYQRAQRRGLRSRAAVKLEDLDHRFRLFRPGLRVVELGCWPGGWLQVAADRVGPRGRVVGVDLQAVEALNRSNVRVIQDDAREAGLPGRVLEALGSRADLLMSDMAPKLSGVRLADAARQTELLEAAVTVASGVLSDEGRAVIKLFDRVQQEGVEILRGSFRRVAVHRPDSSRKGSSEIYAVAEGLLSPRNGPET